MHWIWILLWILFGVFCLLWIASAVLTRQHFWLMVQHRLYQAGFAYQASELLGQGNVAAVRGRLIELGPPERHGISAGRWSQWLLVADTDQLTRAVAAAVAFCKRVNFPQHPRPVAPRREEDSSVSLDS